MNKLLISTALAGIMAVAGPAFAQGHDGNRQDKGRHEQNAGPPPRQAPKPQPQPQQQAARPQIGGRFGHGYNPGGQKRAQNAPAAQHAAPVQQAQGRAPDQRGREDNRRSAGQQHAPAAQPAPRAAMRDQGSNNAMRGPRQRTERNFAAFHRNFNAPRHFHAPAYRRPRGWYAHRWTYGEILPSLFWASDFWLNDYMDFGLEPPPPGTVWVRDGDDALLIDRYTGEIIQVEYSVFY